MKAAIAFITFVISTIIFVVFVEWIRAADLSVEVKATLMTLFFLAGISFLYLAGAYTADLLHSHTSRGNYPDEGAFWDEESGQWVYWWFDDPIADFPLHHVQLQDPPYDYEKEDDYV